MVVHIGSLGNLPMSNRSCFVYGCFSTAANKPHLGFHKFPIRGKRNIVVVKKNGDRCIYDRRQLWIDALNIGREAASAIDGVNVYVCSLHFARDDFYYNQDITGRRYLKEFAIPRRNLPARSSSALTTKFNVRSLNRIKYRGYFNIHNPDGRKLTAPRRFLGASKFKDPIHSQSYTKTVWVVRKPTQNRDQNQQSCSQNDGTEHDDELSCFPSGNNSQSKTTVEGEEENEQCTILKPERTTSPWFTSELIIKEEPLSDSEQEPQEQVIEKNIEVSNYGEDGNYDPDKVMVETEDAEEKESSTAEYVDEGVETTDEGEMRLPDEMKLPDVEREGFEESLAEEFEQTMEEFDSEEYEQTEEVFENAETTNDTYEENEVEEQDCDVTVVHVDSEEEYDCQQNYYEGGICHICGSDSCEGHPRATRPRENYFVCLVCSEMFPSQKQLTIHSLSHQEMSEEEMQLLEERTKSLTCEFCGRVLSTKSTLREHIMIHTGEKPHECLLCGKSFRHKANLVVHVNGHAVVSTYKCKKCNKAFTKKMDFEKHLKYHVDASGNPLVCKICNAVFKSQRTLYNHSQLHSRKGMVRAKKRSDGPREPVHVCNICSKVLSTKATLKEHMMIHSGEKPHECPICGRTIRHKANFVVHIQTHGQGKSYECDMCDEAFMKKSDLTQHKQVSHSKSKLLRCPICSEVFKSPQKFNRHMEIHESVVYMNETEELTGFEPHLLEGFLED